MKTTPRGLIELPEDGQAYRHAQGQTCVYDQSADRWLTGCPLPHDLAEQSREEQAHEHRAKERADLHTKIAKDAWDEAHWTFCGRSCTKHENPYARADKQA